MMEEAEKRDHRNGVKSSELLFMISEEVGKGLPLCCPTALLSAENGGLYVPERIGKWI